MTKQAAIDAMMQGKKVRHKYFVENEWMKSSPNGLMYYFEDGYFGTAEIFWSYRQEDYWLTGWEIVK
jgi:hypothetical protein